ncbi:ThuA domain-containing protein [Planctomicrobium piriforme]|uniref:Trehalose utilisation n=1 Tax=Planctomicrobium piriforme TaxID=1576369 RepID=A0A1I3QXR6_9PLAN|nr:ThuA domain-containing protein [Planctomicrobium piriforme]SFJ37947.1 Trehalose utilisation [Planctomicrobium piriforme]
MSVSSSRWLRVFLSLTLLAASQAVFVRGSLADDPPVKPLKALLVLGGCCHDYEAQKDILSKGISDRAHVEVTIAYDPDKTTKHLNPIYENPDWAKGYDVIIHDECTADVKDVAIIERILEPHRNGLPGVVLHCAMHSFRSEGFPGVTPWFQFTGLQTTGHGPQTPIDISFVDPESPITRGLSNWTTTNEELYNNSAGKLLDSATALARGHQVTKNKQGMEVTADNVLIWTNNYEGKAKIFGTTLGHNNVTVSDPKYLDLVTRGLLWSCGKLNDTYLKTPETK